MRDQELFLEAPVGNKTFLDFSTNETRPIRTKKVFILIFFLNQIIRSILVADKMIHFKCLNIIKNGQF